MINEKDYIDWIEGKKIIPVSAGGDPVFSLMEKYGVPDMQFKMMLFYEVQALKPLSSIYDNPDTDKLGEQTVIASCLGDQICIDAEGKVNLISQLDLSKTFVNGSFDEFISFFILIDRLLGHVNYRVISKATKEQAELVRAELKKKYNIDWDLYVFWDKITRELTKEPLPVIPVVQKNKPEMSSMQTILIKLDPSKLTNPDLDIAYDLPDRIEEYTVGEVKDNGYDYLPDNVLCIWLKTADATGKVGQIIKLIKEEEFAGNDLSASAEILVSEDDTAEADACRKVFPAD